jgi:hypothetical protein
MKVRAHTQTEEVAGGRSATSAQPRRAIASFTARLSPSHGPHPISPFFAFGTTGAPLESLRCYPLSARSRKRTRFVEKTFPDPSPALRNYR